MLTEFILALGLASSLTAPCPDSADVGKFLSQFLAGLSPAERVPRGALVVVCGDTSIFASGFGETQSGTAVDPNVTLFRAASNSKLFAATAAMQLAASGRWKLTDDVNRYLPVSARLDDGYGRQIRIADLLTHTAGFEDKFDGSLVLQNQRLSLAGFFERNRPIRVRPAGIEVSYSNIGMALAGYAVEAASGESFDLYSKRHIFEPLGMSHSTFAQPLPDGWNKDIATAPPRAGRGIVFLPYPAASLVTTPADMGRFISAHLSDGKINRGGRILPPDAVAEMHRSHWRAQRSVPGVAYGFFEGEINDRRTLFHTGDSGDHSVVFLMPDERVGLYFVYSGTDEQTGVREQFVRSFSDRYFPKKSAVA
ncbi:MAG: serine hydrolase domain-containing protein, partial [Gemmatimonadales bacterium]